MIRAGMSYEDVAYEVCSAFEGAGVQAVLVGGGAATFYAPEAYQSRDLDFVLPLRTFQMPPLSILTELGFEPTRTGGTYAHPETPFSLEVMHGPLAVGEEVLTSWATHHKGELILHVIHPLDSVKDRLASAIHYKDFAAAKQAAEVAKRHPVDLSEVRSWCEKEGGLQVFEVFRSFLEP